MVQECFSQIGNRFDMITRSLKRNYLPYDAEVEYIQNDGTNWIDTGIESAPNLDFSLTFMFPNEIPSSFQMGVGGEQFPDVCCFMFSSGNNFFITNYCSANGGAAFSKSSLSEFKTIKTIGNIGIVNQEAKTNQNKISSSYITGKTIPLFAKKYITTTLEENIHNIVEEQMRISQVAFYQDGKIISLFIPVRRGTEGFLYDMFSGEMVGSATDTPLIPGPDKS